MAENENPVMFREAFAGYSKKDVNRYLSSLSEEFSRRETESEEKLSRLQRDLAEEKRKNTEFSEKLDELACEVYASCQKACSGDIITEKLRDEKRGLEEKLDELACELYAAQEREEKLKEAIAGFCARIAEYEKVSEKAEETHQMTDELCERMGDRISEILKNAGDTADEIITSAQDRSDELVTEATREAARIRSDAAEEARRTDLKMKAMYKDAANEYYEEVAQFAEEIRASVNGLLRDIGARSSELGGKIDYMRLECENAARIGIVDSKATEKPSTESKNGQTVRTPQSTNQPQKKSASGTIAALDEKIEEFFRNTMATLNTLRGKSHDKA